MIDINIEAEKLLKTLGCKVVYQYPEKFTGDNVISYYTLAESGAFYTDNSECIQNGRVQVDIWAKSGKECSDIAICADSVMTSNGWTREMSMDVPKKDEKLFHKTMRFQKYFTL